MKAVVLCAGYGTRLGDLTRETPKAMLPVNGEPLLAHTLRYLARFGFCRVAVNLHFKPDVIVDYFGDGSRFGVQLHYSHEETLLGTAGAVKNLEAYLSDAADFLVMYGDILTDHDLAAMLDFHLEKKASATLLLHQRKGSNSLVEMDESNRITDFIERPTPEQRHEAPHQWVNSGLQILNRRMLAHIPAGGPADLPRDVYIPSFKLEPIYGVPLTGYRYAIDSPQRYLAAQAALEPTASTGLLLTQSCAPSSADRLTISWDTEDIKVEYPWRRRWFRALIVRLGRWVPDIPADWLASHRYRVLRPVKLFSRAREMYLQKKEYENFFKPRLHQDTLTEDQIVNMVQQATEAFTAPKSRGETMIERRRRYFETQPVDQTVAGQIIPLVEAIFRHDSEVRSVLNIGCRYAFVDHRLAEKHPGIRFHCCDFPPNLEDLNGEFRRDNLAFTGGYALSLLESDSIAGDVAVFSSTATLINNLELRRYLRALQSRARYVVFNEPIMPPLDGSVLDPAKLPVDKSAASLRRMLVHNYKAMAAEAGFETVFYRIFCWPEPIGDAAGHLLQLIARGPGRDH